MRLLWILSITIVILSFFACDEKKSSQKSDEDDPTEDAGEDLNVDEDEAAEGTGVVYPDFYELAKSVAPSLTEESNIDLGTSLRLGDFSSTYSTDSDEFSDAFGFEQDYIGQVLNDAGPQGPVKSIFVLLAKVQSTLDRVNSLKIEADQNAVALNENGDEGNGNSTQSCQPTKATDIKTPFFETATNAAFNAWEDSGKYECYTSDNNEVLVFGSQVIENPPEGCAKEEAREYFVMQGGGSKDSPNTEQVEQRGDKVDGSGINKFYYNGCTGDLKLAYAQSTLYSAGVEFSSRTELTGNTKNHSFTLRSNFIDTDPTWAYHNSFIGHGVSKKAAAADPDVFFIMGYRHENCGNSTDSTNCTEEEQKSFCVRNPGTGGNFALEKDSTKCADYEDTYTGISALERSDLPSGYLEINSATVGL